MTHNAVISSLIIFSWSAIAAALAMMTAPSGQDHTAREVSEAGPSSCLTLLSARHSGEKASGGKGSKGGSCSPWAYGRRAPQRLLRVPMHEDEAIAQVPQRTLSTHRAACAGECVKRPVNRKFIVQENV